MSITSLLEQAIEKNVSDIFVVSGAPLSFKLGDSITPVDENKLLPADTEAFLREIYALAGHLHH